MPQTIIAANWKMYKTQTEATSTARDLCARLPASLDRNVIIFPPFTSIGPVVDVVAGKGFIQVGGQNVYPAPEGAYTGEISPGMLRDAGAAWVLVGHSERRRIMGEGLDFIRQKVEVSLQNELNVLLCVGETLEERGQGRLQAVLDEQLNSVIKPLAPLIAPQHFAVAYEPVWAIGTGKVAGPTDISEAHAVARAMLEASLGCGGEISLLYGGSVKPDNAGVILTVPNVDGVLVGGASLKAESFAKIATA